MSKIIASTYELVDKIGSGGGGNVFLAIHLRLGKKVVLKADKRKITTRPELLRREVDVLKNLSHSNIPQVYDFFSENETVYTVMDFIDGESLDKPLKRGEKIPQYQVVKWAIQLLDALCYLHSPIHGEPPHGFVHSDIKPANLIRTPYNDICLIDFNIALAIGEENVVGCSAGYASPEHYGLNFSTGSGTVTADNATILLEDDRETLTLSDIQSGSSGKRIVIPDARSDIYSVGATLYHLLSGKKPKKHARDVIPLSEKEFSPQIVEIISKAMNPNPDLRYQTAEEMRNAFIHLRENDPRAKSFRRNRRIASLLVSSLFVAGVFSSFIGLKRMQITESWLKLAEYSQNALEEGDTQSALRYALGALPEKNGIFIPACIPEAQNALTETLGVYDLSDGFKIYKTVKLPSEPLYMKIAPDGKTAACIYTDYIAVFDTETAEIIVTLPAEKSALAEVEYLNDHTIIYAGKSGIIAYDIMQEEELWSGSPATAICISQDQSTVAAIYKDGDSAEIYDAATGQMKCQVDFDGRCQQAAVNDNFANPNNNLFTLNQDGSLLGVSFSDGSLTVFDLVNSEENILILDEESGYTHFEGGFYQRYFAFSATSAEKSVFAVIDSREKSQIGGFESESYFSVQTDEKGIYVQEDNVLVRIDPITGEQTPLVATSSNILRFSPDDTHTLIASDEGVMFFDEYANLISLREEEYSSDFIQIKKGTALIGSLNTPVISIMKYENYSNWEIFSYDASYEHDEARISADGKTIMLFSYKQFRIYDMSGNVIAEVSISDPEQVYDQQYVRDEDDSYLEVTYNDGTVYTYSAADGSLLYEEKGEIPDMTLYEEFVTDTLRIESPLHGTPVAYDRKTDKLVSELEEDAYLTYVTQVGAYIIIQYITSDDESYGILMNDKCEILARLPYLCDIIENELIFDYPTGNIRKSHIYSLDELVMLAKNELAKEDMQKSEK